MDIRNKQYKHENRSIPQEIWKDWEKTRKWLLSLGANLDKIVITKRV